MMRFAPHFLLFVIPSLLYLKTLGFEFVPSWDDAEYIINNPFIRGVTFTNIKASFTEVFLSNYAPVHIISYMLDYSFWDLNPTGYHLTNLVIHATNAVVLYLLTKKITGNPGVSFATALLFSVHPLNIENVAWVTERKTLLATFFSLLSLLVYLKFRDKRTMKLFIIAFSLFALALLSKPVAVVVPLIITAYEMCFGNIKKRERLLPQAPYYLLALLMAKVTVWAQMSTDAVKSENLSVDILLNTVYPTMVPIFWKYIKLIIAPFGLSGFYDTQIYTSWLDPYVAVSVTAWAAVCIAVVWKGSPQIKFWFLWFWIWLLPVSNIIPLEVYYADRYMYMPAVGVLLLFTLTLNRLTGGGVPHSWGLDDSTKDRGNVFWGSSWLTRGTILLGVIYLTTISINRIPVWHDEVSFWEDAATKSPGRAKTHFNLGYAYDIRGRFADAEKEYLEAAKIYPDPGTILSLKMVRSKAAYQKSIKKPSH
jgi:hypothetical protein